MALALRIQFLQGTYQAAEPGEISEPEWPPHPARAHAALVSAGWACRGDAFPDSREANALKWLESAGPPTLTLPEHAARRSSPTVYVPRNPTAREISDMRGSLGRGDRTAYQRQSGRVDRTFPTMIVGDDPVWLCWSDDPPPDEVSDALHDLVTYVSYLGSSRSPVVCALADQAPDPTLVPVSANGTYGLRVATPGFTEGLIESRFSTGGMSAATHPYRHSTAAAPDMAETPAPGPFASMIVLRRAKGFNLTVAHAEILARALRKAVLAAAGDGAPAVLHGHGCDPHVAFMPLATVGHRHSGGEVRGFALAVPVGTSREDTDAVVAAARAITRVAITRDIVPWRVEHLPDPAEVSSPDPDSTLRTLDPARWIGPARTWATATPIVLDRHTRPGRPDSVEDMVRSSFENALLPAPTSIEISSAPFIGGAVPAGVHAQTGKPGGSVLHVRARFARPVRGPMLVGRGRYRGLGIFAPIPEGSTG